MDIRPKKKHHYNIDDFDDDDIAEAREVCPTDPDLILLRQNARGEREAIAFYLRAAARTTNALRDLFLDTARDEMVHFRNSMTLLAKYDPPQAQAFTQAGINLPVGDLRMPPAANNVQIDRLEVVDLLTRAITSELEAINMYQTSYEAAEHADVKTLFCNNANDEKVHVAEFWKTLITYTKETVPLA